MAGIAFGRFDDSFSLATLKAYVAEFISTLLFVFAGVGSAIAYGKYTFTFHYFYLINTLALLHALMYQIFTPTCRFYAFDPISHAHNCTSVLIFNILNIVMVLFV